MKVIRSIDDAKALEGEEVGLSDWIVIDQHRIDQFAEATADYQWIHVDTERAAKEMPNGKTIAHGYLTLALIPALTGRFVDVVNLERAGRRQATWPREGIAGAPQGGRVAADVGSANRNRGRAQAGLCCRDSRHVLLQGIIRA